MSWFLSLRKCVSVCVCVCHFKPRFYFTVAPQNKFPGQMYLDKKYMTAHKKTRLKTQFAILQNVHIKGETFVLITCLNQICQMTMKSNLFEIMQFCSVKTSFSHKIDNKTD